MDRRNIRRSLCRASVTAPSCSMPSTKDTKACRSDHPLSTLSGLHQPRAAQARKTSRPLHGVIHDGEHSRLLWETLLLHGLNRTEAAESRQGPSCRSDHPLSTPSGLHQPRAAQARKTSRPLHDVIHDGRHSRLLWETFLLHGQSTHQCCTIQARPIVHQSDAIMH